MAVYNSGGAAFATPPARKVNFDNIGKAFNLVKEQLGVWIPTMLVYVLVVGVISTVSNLILQAIGLGAGSRGGNTPPTGLVVAGSFLNFGINLVAGAFFQGGLYRMALKQVRGEAISISDLFSSGDVVAGLAVGQLLIALMLYAGVLALCIGAFIVAGLTMFVLPLIVDQRLGAVEAIGTSFNTLKSDLVNATGFYFVSSLAAGLGILACGIGVLFTAPILPLAVALTYQDFFGAGGASLDPAIEMPLPPQTPLA